MQTDLKDPAVAIRRMRDALTQSWGLVTAIARTEEMRFPRQPGEAGSDGFGVAFGYASGQVNVKILRNREWVAKETWTVESMLKPTEDGGQFAQFLAWVLHWMQSENAVPVSAQNGKTT